MQTAPKRLLNITHEFKPRPARFLGIEEFGDWRMKLYGLTAEHKRLLPDLVAEAKKLVQKTLPKTLTNEYGVGFVGIHCGRDSNFVFIDWWANENELHHHVFISTVEQPLDLRRAPEGVSACVWDLQVIWFERNMWVEKVLNNPRGPDLEAYLKKVLDDA